MRFPALELSHGATATRSGRDANRLDSREGENSDDDAPDRYTGGVAHGADEGVGPFAAMSGTDAATYMRERPDLSAFALEAGAVYHAPKGRNEKGLWFRRHDEYGKG